MTERAYNGSFGEQMTYNFTVQNFQFLDFKVSYSKVHLFTSNQQLLFSNFLFNITVKEIIASKIVTEKVSDNMKQPAAIMVLQYWYTILVIPVFDQYLQYWYRYW